MKTNAFVKDVITTYSKVSPEWHPPHKTIFKMARKHGFTAVIDGLTESSFNKKWWKLFEQGTLEGEFVTVELLKNKKKSKLKFESDDLREIHLK